MINSSTPYPMTRLIKGYKSVRYVYVNVVLNYVDAVETEHIVLSYHKIL